MHGSSPAVRDFAITARLATATAVTMFVLIVVGYGSGFWSLTG